jgi:hypothetical protein
MIDSVSSSFLSLRTSSFSLDYRINGQSLPHIVADLVSNRLQEKDDKVFSRLKHCAEVMRKIDES